MPRDGSGVYSKASASFVANTTITSSSVNADLDDLVADANTARPITAGGTGAQTAAAARTALGSTTVGDAVFVAADAGAARTTLSAFGVVRTQVFTSSGTYTPNANMVYCEIECQGAGGGGGGAANSSGIGTGGGGGAGTYSRRLASAADIGASKTVTVGAAGSGGTSGGGGGGSGGASSLGALCTAPGGNLGAGAAANGQGSGGAASLAGTGDISIPGGGGAVGVATTLSSVFGIGGGFGGASVLGPACYRAGDSGSYNGVGYGSGGGGGSSNSSTGAIAGGSGAPGIVIITEYCSA